MWSYSSLKDILLSKKFITSSKETFCQKLYLISSKQCPWCIFNSLKKIVSFYTYFVSGQQLKFLPKDNVPRFSTFCGFRSNTKIMQNSVDFNHKQIIEIFTCESNLCFGMFNKWLKCVIEWANRFRGCQRSLISAKIGFSFSFDLMQGCVMFRKNLTSFEALS